MVYPALPPLMGTPQLPAVDWTDAPTNLNGLVYFAERRNLVSARVPSHFKRTLPQSVALKLLTASDWEKQRTSSIWNRLQIMDFFMKTRSLCGMSLKWPSPGYFVNVFIECFARNFEDLAYKSESDRLSLIRQRNVYTSLVNHALNIKTFQTFIALHKIHRVKRRKAINMSEHTVECNYYHHALVQMQHDAKIVPGIFHEYNWCYGQYLGSLNLVLLLCWVRCKDLIATRSWLSVT
jgi:hypothetical protein